MRVGERLAVLGGEQPRELVELALHQLEKLEQHARAPLRIGGGPGRLRGLRNRDGVRDLGALGEGDLGLHLAGIGIEHVAGAAGSAGDLLAADEMADLTHRRPPLHVLRLRAGQPPGWPPNLKLVRGPRISLRYLRAPARRRKTDLRVPCCRSRR